MLRSVSSTTSSLRPTPRLYAHRGAAAEQPENTVPSFHRAMELGADALEMDLHMTSDGVIVVSHDRSGLRMTGVAAEIRQCRMDEVQSWDAGFGFTDSSGQRPFAGRGYAIPTFEEILETFPDIPINVDVKQWDPSMNLQLLRLIRRKQSEHRVIIASFRLRTLRKIRALGYRGPTALAQPEVIGLLCAPRPALRLVQLGNAAQIPAKAGPIVLGRRSFIDKCHRLGMRVDFWTINDPLEAKHLLELGADGIMTDDPAAIAPVFEAVATERS